jgi:hypothetical protein
MTHNIEIDDGELKHGVLGLVVALVEVIVDALRTQAVRRVESQTLSDDEIERLGLALLDLDGAIAQLKEEQGISEVVRSVRSGLDHTVDDLLRTLVSGEDTFQGQRGADQ